MKEKFRFTDYRNNRWEDMERITTSIYGVRNVGGVKEEIIIIAILSTTGPARVVYLLYENEELISREVEHSTDTMGLCKKVHKYIDDLEK